MLIRKPYNPVYMIIDIKMRNIYQIFGSAWYCAGECVYLKLKCNGWGCARDNGLDSIQYPKLCRHVNIRNVSPPSLTSTTLGTGFIWGKLLKRLIRSEASISWAQSSGCSTCVFSWHLTEGVTEGGCGGEGGTLHRLIKMFLLSSTDVLGQGLSSRSLIF